jgi:hypothetical protein
MKSDRRRFMKLAAAASAFPAGHILGADGPAGAASPPLPQEKGATTSADKKGQTMIKPYLAMMVQSKVIAAKGMAEVHQNPQVGL